MLFGLLCKFIDIPEGVPLKKVKTEKNKVNNVVNEIV